jgi:hypothetical protein
MAAQVVERLSSEWEALSSISSATATTQVEIRTFKAFMCVS